MPYILSVARTKNSRHLDGYLMMTAQTVLTAAV